MMEAFPVDVARAHRQRAYHAANVLVNNKQYDLDWSTLPNLPDWCYFSSLELTRLSMLCGSLFIAPLIRLWVDGKKLKHLRNLLGVYDFDAVMSSDVPNIGPVRCDVFTEDLEQQVKACGASVLYFSSLASLHDVVTVFLPAPYGQKLEVPIAASLLSHAYRIMAAERQSISSSLINENPSMKTSVSNTVHDKDVL